jgi:hypothetical protein
LPFLSLPRYDDLSCTRANLAADGGSQTFDYLSSQYFEDIYFKFAPTAGTSAGLHQYDSQLEDYSAAGTQREVAALHEFEKKLDRDRPYGRSMRSPPRTIRSC